jgi:2-dehydro-3-deoxygalactonokinase
MKIISCDWGTSSFRLKIVDVDTAEVLAEYADDKGIHWLSRQFHDSGLSDRTGYFLRFLQQKLEKLNDLEAKNLPIFVSGMASSSIGIWELAYAPVPFSLEGKSIISKKITSESQDLYIFSGVKTDNDVMRGEETQLIGGCPADFRNGMVILTGTHSKHAQITEGVLTGIKTYMTGEFFHLLAHESILAATISDENAAESAKNPHFTEGVKMATQTDFLNAAFHVRTRTLLQGAANSDNYAFLSGLMIGTELRNLAAMDTPLHIISNKNLELPYLKAAEILLPHHKMTWSNADVALVKGHCILAQQSIKSF